MNANKTSDNLIVREFTAPKQIKLFTSLQESQISGQLTFTDPIQGNEWHLYLYLGGIVYGTGGIHPIRRWQRNLITNLPQIPFQLSTLQEELTERDADLSNNIWEYEQLSHWVEQQIITPQQGSNAVLFVLSEIFFDLTQAKQVICRLNQNNILAPKIEPIEAKELINLNQQVWQTWEEAAVADRQPDLAPVILQPKELQKKTSISAYQSLCKLLNGNRTLRDLSVQLKTSPIQVVCSLLPYIQSGIFGLVGVPDLLELLTSSNGIYEDGSRPLIACVDDSLMISHMMEQIISIAGYRFVAINDPTEAVATLLARKPDLIFLDVVMPQISGYDLCAQLRKYSEFDTTPIIFLTSNSGIVDRIRAKMVGSTDFLKKTVDADELLEKVVEYLP
ncbi:response regulator [Waterburya agarophytonicola K14]|uniref:Response regulator n=1 Tax=Waterburya agarophytonicola KI4 TaxID=2874699 RepID=A0A964BQ68_9CYAN|nr:response regulator [Waterburya agarophytonicola]MCC0177573.1 response regulator [Waterburya agarophytonicola KI4]